MLHTILAGLVATAAATPLLDRRATTGQAYASNNGLSMKLSSIPGPILGGVGSNTSSSTWNLTIDDTSSGYKQTITGFGGAVTDSTVTTFNELDSGTLSQLLDDLMTSNGANFGLLRHTIGASDLSASPAYSYDDSGSASNPSLSGFGLGDRGTAMAKMLASMKALNSATKILGSPWSPPAWMKLNDAIDGNTNCNNLNDGYDTSCSSTGPNVASYFAQYFVQYIQAYQNLGASIDAITIQNEPLNSQSGYPTMYVYADESANLIQNYVGPALANANLGNVKIWALDHNTQYESYAQTVLNNASQYVDTVAWHCYDSPDWSVLSSIKSQFPNVEQYMTECYTPPESAGADGAWNAAANFVIGPLQNWASGAMAWDIGADSSYGPHLDGGCTDCQGLVTINSGSSYTLNSAYYQIAQFSKYMPAGATVLSGSGSYSYSDGTGIQSVATVNPDGTRSVVMVNAFSNSVYIRLKTASGQMWGGSIPAEATTTWILPST